MFPLYVRFLFYIPNLRLLWLQISVYHVSLSALERLYPLCKHKIATFVLSFSSLILFHVLVSLASSLHFQILNVSVLFYFFDTVIIGFGGTLYFLTCRFEILLLDLREIPLEDSTFLGFLDCEVNVDFLVYIFELRPVSKRGRAVRGYRLKRRKHADCV